MELIACGDSALLVRLGTRIDTATHRRTVALFRHFLRLSDPRIRNLHPAYASLLIDFDPLACDCAQVQELVRTAWTQTGDDPARSSAAHEVPVCYDSELGEDFPEVCRLTGLSAPELIAAHTAPEYIVYFLGFSPGFAYLGGLPSNLACARLATPRRAVPAGSVAIGGEQTGIYPVTSPGGWRLIGRTPIPLLQPDNHKRPMLFEPGDTLRFVSIDRARYEELLNAKL